jgi:predicted nuclease of restriction endonuclease-like (RecB) superfamily
MKLNNLVSSIEHAQVFIRKNILTEVNKSLTIRNWIIGLYIVEYEQNGTDRAKYGERYMHALAEKLCSRRLIGFSARNLYLFRDFYKEYPLLQAALPDRILQTLSAKSGIEEDSLKLKAIAEKNTCGSKQSDPAVLLRCFSFSHFVELMKVEDEKTRSFYETEAIKGAWSVRQLKRQIGSMLYERTGLSTNKQSVINKVNADRDVFNIEDTIRDPYILEFAGLKDRPEYSENDLETALLNHIQEFLLELGTGFCFEGRQFRITVGGSHDRIDLVFYHRVLRCHVLIDLKIREFTHTDAGQMNYYLNYFKDNIMKPGDNPPVGLVLCTYKDKTKVAYATSGMDNKLFVSKYKVYLPSEKELLKELEKEKDDFMLKESRAKYGK